jgi:hypothetical protein
MDFAPFPESLIRIIWIGLAWQEAESALTTALAA